MRLPPCQLARPYPDGRLLCVGDGTLATATNVKGKLAYVWDLSGEEHTSHDARDRVAWVVKRVRDPLHGQLVSYRTGFDYDALDRLTSLTYPDNDAIGYRYNDRSLLQAITQINEATLTFIPKLVAAVIVFSLAGPWMLNVLIDYIRRTIEAIPASLI